MTRNVFREPVRILVGLGYPRNVRDPLDAMVYLNELPTSSRNDAYKLALGACQAAVMGEIEADTARDAFEAYARRNDVLAPATHALPRRHSHTF